MCHFRDIYFEIKYKKRKTREDKPTANITLNAEKLKAFLLR